jgi:hypothetical protein
VCCEIVIYILVYTGSDSIHHLSSHATFRLLHLSHHLHHVFLDHGHELWVLLKVQSLN